MKREIVGRDSNTNYSYLNSVLKGFTAAKLIFPMFVQVQRSSVSSTADSHAGTISASKTSCSVGTLLGFFTCAFLLFLYSKSGSEAVSCKQIKLISHANSAKLGSPIFYPGYL